MARQHTENGRGDEPDSSWAESIPSPSFAPANLFDLKRRLAVLFVVMSLDHVPAIEDTILV